jgi:hypothetical protein
MLKIRRTWKHGRGGIHFNNIFVSLWKSCVIANWLQSGNLALLLRILCVGYADPAPRGPTGTLGTRPPNLGWYMIATKIQKILLKCLPPHPRFHMRLMINFNVLRIFKCCKFYHFLLQVHTTKEVQER